MHCSKTALSLIMSEENKKNSQGELPVDSVEKYTTIQQEAAVKALEKRTRAKVAQLSRDDILRISKLPTKKCVWEV